MSSITDQIEDTIKDYLDDQPYAVHCSFCGEKLNYTSEIDKDLDIFVHVDPCPQCKEEE